MIIHFNIYIYIYIYIYIIHLILVLTEYICTINCHFKSFDAFTVIHYNEDENNVIIT